ncbi:MAG: AarF/UbiB family protein [Rikenellaceae bacterium]
MNIISIYITLLKIKRALQILGVVIKLAFTEMFDHIKIYLFQSRHGKKQRPLKTYTTPQRIRQTIEQLGPTYIKFGQILADRPDVVSANFRSELKKLQSSARPFDNKLAFSLIEKSLGESVDDVFSYFSDTPIAAASIGQVYDAQLKSGEKVIVKIQRPFIDNKIKLDIYLMKILAKKLAKNYPELAAINIVGLIDEFSESITKELDYNNETNNLKLFEELFEDNENVKIPKVYDQYSTRTLIVMEKMEGVTPDSVEALIEAGLTPSEVVKNGTDTIIQMILRYGVFHADPHPGNLFIGENNQIRIIDFGMVGVLRPREMDFIADFILGFYKKDETGITRSLLTLCDKHYFENYEELRFDIKQMIMHNLRAAVVDLHNFSNIMQKSIDLMIKHKLQVPSGIFLLMKTFLTLEKFAISLDPTVDISKIVLPYAKEVVTERFSFKKVASEVYDTFENYINLFQNLPANLNEIIFKLKEGKIKHEIFIDDNTIFRETIRNVSRTIAYVILIIGLFIGSSILIVWDSDRTFGLVILYFSTVLILLLLLRWIFKRKLF